MSNPFRQEHRIERLARLMYAASPSYFNGKPISWDAAINGARSYFRTAAEIALWTLDDSARRQADAEHRLRTLATMVSRDPWNDDLDVSFDAVERAAQAPPPGSEGGK